MSDGKLVLVPHTINASFFVETLESCGGNLKDFTARIASSVEDSTTDEIIVAGIERMLALDDDKTLYKRWTDAIKANIVVRLRLLQGKALDRLEAMNDESADGEKMVFKMSEEIAFAKLVLGDIIAAQLHAVKQKPTAIIVKDDDDEADLAEVMDGA